MAALTMRNPYLVSGGNRVLYGNDTFVNKKDKISSHGKIMTKVRYNVGNRNGSN